LSDEGKKLGAAEALEVWFQNKLSNHKWLHGGIEIVDEVCMTLFSGNYHLYDSNL